MGLRVLATVGLAVVAATAGAVEGWRHSPDSPNDTGYWTTVATRMPAGSPVHVMPECTFTSFNTLKNTDGSTPDNLPRDQEAGPIPADFVPVRAVRCAEFWNGGSETATRAEIREPGALNALLAAYRTTKVREYREPIMDCTDNLDLDPAIALVDAHGTAIWPAPPRDTCGHIVTAVNTFFTNDQWIVTDSVTIH